MGRIQKSSGEPVVLLRVDGRELRQALGLDPALFCVWPRRWIVTCWPYLFCSTIRTWRSERQAFLKPQAFMREGSMDTAAP